MGVHVPVVFPLIHPTVVDPTTVTLLGSHSNGGGGGSQENIPPKPPRAAHATNDDNEDRFSFGSLHAALGQPYMQDRLKRRQEEEQQQQKLQEESPRIEGDDGVTGIYRNREEKEDVVLVNSAVGEEYLVSTRS